MEEILLAALCVKVAEEPEKKELMRLEPVVVAEEAADDRLLPFKSEGLTPAPEPVPGASSMC